MENCVFIRYAVRTSSAHWDADEMTLVEKRVYRKHMGYDQSSNPNPSQTPRAGANPNALKIAVK